MFFCVSPAGGGRGGRFNVTVMFISYRLEVLYPPPSLRDTSASGGYRMTFFAIATQFHSPGRLIVPYHCLQLMLENAALYAKNYYGKLEK